MAETYRSAHCRLEWRGREVQARVRKLMAQRLAAVGAAVAEQVKQNISVPGDRKTPSAPDDFPHDIGGELRASIFWRMDGDMCVIIGSTSRVALFLEYGTSKMRARSFLRRTLREMRGAVRHFLVDGGQAASLGMVA